MFINMHKDQLAAQRFYFYFFVVIALLSLSGRIEQINNLLSIEQIFANFRDFTRSILVEASNYVPFGLANVILATTTC